MGTFLQVLGLLICIVAGLAVAGTLNNAVALADALLFGVCGAVLLGCGCIVEAVGHVERTIRDLAKPKPSGE